MEFNRISQYPFILREGKQDQLKLFKKIGIDATSAPDFEAVEGRRARDGSDSARRNKRWVRFLLSFQRLFAIFHIADHFSHIIAFNYPTQSSVPLAPLAPARPGHGRH